VIKKKVSRLLVFIYEKLSSTKVFIFALALLVFQSTWLALTAVYPLPFDEYYHVGIIKIYAQQWSPFISSQSDSASLYGDITRYPSYLYHYLMSFPYRFLDIFLNSETAIIICLRMMNIAFVVVGLLLFRKLFTKAGVSKRIINAVFLLIVVTPIVPFLVAHVNYDNFMFMLAPVVFGFGYKIFQSKKIDSFNLSVLIMVGLFTSLVKNSFLPVFSITLLSCLVVAIASRGFRISFKDLICSFSALRTKVKFVLFAGLMLVTLLFAERYGYNVVKYQTLWPKCDVIQSEQVCKHFMPWYRNSQNKLYPPTEQTYGNPASFTQHWVSKMSRGYFAIFSHTPANVLKWYEPFGPIVLGDLLPLPISVYSVLVVGGAIVFVLKIRKLWANNFIRFSIIVSAAYLLVLWSFNYRSYLGLGTAQAIQARYTYPILPLIFLVLASGYNLLRLSAQQKTIMFSIVFLVYFWGGGIAGWIIRSDSMWYWQNSYIISVNQKTQSVLKKLIWH